MIQTALILFSLLKSRFLKITYGTLFRADLARKPQLSVGIVAPKLKLVLRPRVYTQSVCNFPQLRCDLLHVVLLNIASLQLFPPVKNVITRVLEVAERFRMV